MTENVEKEVRRLAEEAKAASVELGMASFDVRNAALRAMAASLRAHTEDVLAANAQDMEAARAGGMKDSLLDRLLLTEERVEGMASALEELAALPDSLGRVLEDRTLGNGLRVQRVTVPFGVVAMVYEARPNVTADAAGICVKTGNACVLRSGSSALHSSIAIANVLHEAAVGAGLPRNCIRIVESTDRSSADALMRMHGVVDLLIPRGGAGLIRRCVENATVPVIETGVGNCHIYIDKDADIQMAVDITYNAKTSRVSVCNAAESLLVHKDIAEKVLPPLKEKLDEKNVELRGDEATRAILPGIKAATEEDYATEYLDYILSVHIVNSLEEAIDHIYRYSTGHSECIITENKAAAEKFLAEVDSAAVYHNASTRFTDGGEFGFGAEIGISTQKLHARGPLGLPQLTSVKYKIYGNGQRRE